MKKLVLGALFLVTACHINDVAPEWPEYNRLAVNVNVVEESSSHVIYEYYNVRIDEVAGLAAIYCYDKNNKRRALLQKITTQPDKRRHATFVCD